MIIDYACGGNQNGIYFHYSYTFISVILNFNDLLQIDNTFLNV